MRARLITSGSYTLSAVLLAVLAPVSLCVYGANGIFTGRIVNVHDGDTVTLLDPEKRRHRLRLFGCDAPELSQAFGRASRDSLAARAANRNAVFEHHKKDRYGRAVGKLLVDGEDLCLYQVREGMAWHFSKYAHEQSTDDRVRYAEAEEQARRDRRGLWAEPHPQAPWTFRERLKTRDGLYNGAIQKSGVIVGPLGEAPPNRCVETCARFDDGPTWQLAAAVSSEVVVQAFSARAPRIHARWRSTAALC